MNRDNDPDVALAEDLFDYAAELHARGRRATVAHRHVEGSLCREIANDLRRLLGATPFEYDGKIADPWRRTDPS